MRSSVEYVWWSRKWETRSVEETSIPTRGSPCTSTAGGALCRKPDATQIYYSRYMHYSAVVGWKFHAYERLERPGVQTYSASKNFGFTASYYPRSLGLMLFCTCRSIILIGSFLLPLALVIKLIDTFTFLFSFFFNMQLLDLWRTGHSDAVHLLCAHAMFLSPSDSLDELYYSASGGKMGFKNRKSGKKGGSAVKKELIEEFADRNFQRLCKFVPITTAPRVQNFGGSLVIFFILFYFFSCVIFLKYNPGQKKRTIPEICNKKNTVRSCDILITSVQRRARSSATVRDFCPALIVHDQA